MFFNNSVVLPLGKR